MLRQFSFLCLIVCAVATFTGDSVFAQQPSALPDAVSTLHDSNDIVGELMNTAAEGELELGRCSLTAAPSGGEAQVDLSVVAPGIADVKRFVEKLRRKRTVLVEKLVVKPSVSSASPSGAALFDLVLRLNAEAADGQGGDALTRLVPFDEMPVFNMAQPSIDGARLYSCSIEVNGARSMQIVAPNLDTLSVCLQRGGNAIPGRSKTISRSTVGAVNVFTLDLSDDGAFMPAAELLSLFDRLGKDGDLREISLQMAPDGKRLHKLVLHLTPERLAEAGAQILRESGQSVLKADAVPLAQPTWAVTLLTGSSSASGQPAERAVSPLADVVGLLSAPWPSARRGGLQFTWTPTGVQMDAVVTNEQDVESLKPAATALGLTYQGAKRRESLETGALTVGFGRQLAGAAVGGNSVVDTSLGRFLGFAELLEDRSIQGGRRLAIACDFSEMPGLFEKLRSEYGTRVRSLSIDCPPGSRCKTTLVLSEGDSPDSAAIIATADTLVRASLPWNRPEHELEKGLIVTGVAVEQPDRFAVTGLTLKSRLIFSDLFPALKNIPCVIDPFFEQGRYRDHKSGRLMLFTVTARRVAR